jgi:Arc/MetJ family transcription regulator
MKRTNLVLDEKVLEEATRALGVRTYSAAVNQALKEVVRKDRLRKMASLFGKVEWHGDLAEMREDNPRRPARRRKAAR